MTDTSGTAKSPKGASPSPKTGTVTEVAVEDEDRKEKPAKDIPIIHDSGFFQHDTGDTYDGEFEAKKKELSVKMHGEISSPVNMQVFQIHNENELIAQVYNMLTPLAAVVALPCYA